MFRGGRIPGWADGNILGMDGGDGCLTGEVYSVTVVEMVTSMYIAPQRNLFKIYKQERTPKNPYKIKNV